MFLTRVHDRLLPTGLAHLTEPGPNRTPLRTAAHAYQKAVDDLVRKPAWQNDPHQTGLKNAAPPRLGAGVVVVEIGRHILRDHDGAIALERS